MMKTKHHISYFYNALLEYYPLHQAWCETKWIRYSENELKLTKYVQNARHMHKHKHASLLAIGQLLLQAVPHMR